MSEREPIIPGAGNVQIDFTVHQLTVFRTVAQHLSYTRAAEVLYLSQPAVTQQVRTLEKVLGLQLFTRSGRGIMLTPAGEELLRHAERLLALLAETASVVNEIHALERGSVVIGASTSAGTYVVPSLLSAFHVHYPRIRVTLVVTNRRSIEARLLAHEIDLAVMSLIEQQDRFVLEFLRPYELVVVVQPSHRLMGRSALTLRDLQQETFLLREQESGTRLGIEQHFVHAGVPLRASLQLSSIEAIKEGVVAGLGIAVLPREAVALEVATGDLAILEVQGFPLERQWYVVSLKGRKLSGTATALRQFLLQQEVSS
jgi:LysR family transcriptional regulator, low CO2-responsive transcriptional regulator